ncbi:MAG: hypothetical protein UE068_12080 [Paludibacteraceae bacterium]|nr:hypothetical protein [Paludibacteraceae bacterium]
MLKYNYTYDENKNIINIADVAEDGHLNKVFFCIGCGNQMVAAIGPKRRYFRHKVDETNCCNESYIHKLAKTVIKQKFDDLEKPFEIQLKGRTECNRKQQCKWYNEQNCTNIDLQPSIDLHNYYNCCDEEKRIDGYVADLLLTPKKSQNAPILIEIKHKHECTDEKKDSGLKIIEVWIESEKDIENLKNCKLILCDSRINNYRDLPTIKFYNFNPKTQATEFFERMSNGSVAYKFHGISFQRFVLYPSKRYYVDEIKCIDSNKVYSDVSDLELNCPLQTSLLEIAHYLKRVMNIDLRACSICRYFWKDWYGNRHCNLRRKYEILEENDSYAIDDCTSFQLNWLNSLYKDLPEEQIMKDEDIEIIKNKFYNT